MALKVKICCIPESENKFLHKIFRPIKRIMKKQSIRLKARTARQHYSEIIRGIKESGRRKMNFAAYVIFDSTYGMDGTFQLMMNDLERWNPIIVVIPDISRGEEHQRNTYKKTREFFVKKYGEKYVLDGWDSEKNIFFDHINKFDIVYYANPYDGMVAECHRIKYASDKNVLPIYVSYGYDVGKKTTLDRLTGLELNLIWKLFADSTYTYNDYRRYQLIKGKNVVLAGYSKMDKLTPKSSSNGIRKKILIASHHTVMFKELPLSNFLEYSDLFLKLPSMFPNIDFVFRPHPLLFTTLKNKKLWTDEQIKTYLENLQSAGIEYSTGGEYFGLFCECDAIINDCGSFTVEWLYTGKPGCFMYNKNLEENMLTELMNKAIDSYSIAKSSEDIIAFISKVNNDVKKETYEMKQWVKDNIAINYPNVSEVILKELNILEES